MAAVASTGLPTVPRKAQIVVADDVGTIRRTTGIKVTAAFTSRQIPAESLEVVYVGDGENARKAICGDSFLALSPGKFTPFAHSPCRHLRAAVLDNSMPSNPHTPTPSEDQGIKAAEALRSKERTEGGHLPLFAHSADSDQTKFTQAVFDRVLKKNSPKAEFAEALDAFGALKV